MTKLSLDIDNIEDAGACHRALRRAYQAIKEQHGEGEAKGIFLSATHDPSDDIMVAAVQADLVQWQKGLTERNGGVLRAWSVFFALSPEDVRLAVAYYSMPQPNKQRLANDLAKKNETLPPERRYGPRGTTSPTTMLKQINRVLKKKECGKIAGFTADERKSVLWGAEQMVGRGQANRLLRHLRS
jgi:hypothetical protein